MPEPLKNMYNQEFFRVLTNALKEVLPNFNTTSFLDSVYDNEWESKELKQRMRHVAVVLKNHLSNDYKSNTTTIIKLVNYFDKKGITENTIEFMFLPDFIEIYGLEDYNTSIKTIERVTQFTSCEFAVRPFILQYEKEMLLQLKEWSLHKHHMVRRLATEGCRPRLPWAMAIPSFKKNPSPILPILEQLKNDKAETVRRSVANNLNDISKDHPNVVVQLAKKWIGKNKETDWLVKHACRTLLKQGNSDVLELFGFGFVDDLKVEQLNILTPTVNIGEFLEFEFNLKNTSNTSSKIRLEYAVYYQKANGSLSKKVYKISEKEYEANSITKINRRQSFKVITTRRLHVGLHQLAIILNGKEFDSINFQLNN